MMDCIYLDKLRFCCNPVSAVTICENDSMDCRYRKE